MVDVYVPNWGMSEGEAEVIAWARAVGDRVTAGEPIAELDAAKAVVQVESPADGVLAEILAGVGADVVPGQVIARIEG